MRLTLPFLIATLLILSTNGDHALSAAGAAEQVTGAAAEPAAETILSLDQAREYMLTLINRDRAAHGLAPVTLDKIASQAGQSLELLARAGQCNAYQSCGSQRRSRSPLKP